MKVCGDLYLGRNELTSLPESMGSIQVGGKLGLGANKLTSLPESMERMKRIGKLDLDYNPIQWQKPPVKHDKAQRRQQILQHLEEAQQSTPYGTPISLRPLTSHVNAGSE